MQCARRLPTVVVLATGGTIAGRSQTPGSVTEYESGAVAAETLLAAVPGLADIAVLECAQLANIGSEHMEDAVWCDLAKAVAAVSSRREVNGIVVLHGTDTMEETALFLDCLLGGVYDVPVVLTGAMRPSDAISADGPANLLNAVRVAAEPAAAGRGVLVLFSGVIHEAKRVYKAETYALDAFRSTGRGPAGMIVDGEVVFCDELGVWEWPDLALTPFELSSLPRVGILYGYAGMDERSAAAFLSADWQGVIYAGVGMGNIHAAVRPLLVAASRRGLPVVCSTRIDGGLAIWKAQDRAAGFFCANRLNPQKARVLLQLALSSKVEPDRLQSIFDHYR